MLTFDEFIVAFVQMQRGSYNLSNNWQYLKNNIYPGLLSRYSLLIFSHHHHHLLRRIIQFSNSDRIEQHRTHLIWKLSSFRFNHIPFNSFTYFSIWLKKNIHSFYFFIIQYIFLINNRNLIKFMIIFIVIIILRLLKLFFIRIYNTDITNEITNTFL